MVRAILRIICKVKVRIELGVWLIMNVHCSGLIRLIVIVIV